MSHTTVSSVKFDINQLFSLVYSVASITSDIAKHKQEANDNIISYKLQVAKLDAIISTMVLSPDDIDKGKEIAVLSASAAKHFKSNAEKYLKYTPSEAKVIYNQHIEIAEQLTFIEDFYTFWADTHEAIKSPETKLVSIDEL